MPDDLVIADAEGPVAIAGVIGGAHSEIRNETVGRAPRERVLRARDRTANVASPRCDHRIVVPVRTRRRSRRTRARRLDRVTQLISRARAVVDVAKGVVEERASGRRRTAIRLRPARVNLLLGTALKVARDGAPAARARRERLGAWTASPPRPAAVASVRSAVRGRSRRGDRAPDRVRHWYEATVPAIVAGGPGIGPTRDVEQRLRERLRGAGFDEMITLAMVGRRRQPRFSRSSGAHGRRGDAREPLSSEGAELRRSLCRDSCARSARIGVKGRGTSPGSRWDACSRARQSAITRSRCWRCCLRVHGLQRASARPHGPRTSPI